MNKIILVLSSLIIAAGCSSIDDDTSMVRKVINGFDGEPVVPRGANRLYIAEPVGRAGNGSLPPLLLDRIREYISLDGRLGLEPDETAADLRLEVIITGYMVENMKFDDVGRAVQKRLRITADVTLVNLKKRKSKRVFRDNDMQAFRAYSEIVRPIETENRVAEYVVDELARRISAKTVSGWYTDLMTPVERGK